MRIGLGWVGAALGALLALPAEAQSVGQELRVLHSCSWDVVRLCGGTLPGKGRLPDGVSLASAHMAPYSPLQSHRRSSMTFRAGQPVFILDDPEGTPWVMQAFGQIVNPNLTYATLPSLTQSLRPPPGWRFRVQGLDRDLTISTPRGYNGIVQDEQQNTYDACQKAPATSSRDGKAAVTRPGHREPSG